MKTVMVLMLVAVLGALASAGFFMLRKGEYEAWLEESEDEANAFDWRIDIADDEDGGDDDDDEFDESKFVARGTGRGDTDEDAKAQAMACVAANRLGIRLGDSAIVDSRGWFERQKKRR